MSRWNPKTSAFILDYELSHRRLARRHWVGIEGISPSLIRAVLVAEDDAFFEHGGVDFKEFKASWKTNLRKKRIVRGGSTLTMQLIKNLYLTPRKNPVRKFNEIVLAMDLESKLTKRRILELYLNMIQWGEGIYGAEAASRHYFNKRAGNLTAWEAAYLAAILPNPVYFASKGRARARVRQKIILGRMAGRWLPANF